MSCSFKGNMSCSFKGNMSCSSPATRAPAHTHTHTHTRKDFGYKNDCAARRAARSKQIHFVSKSVCGDRAATAPPASAIQKSWVWISYTP